MKAVLIIAGVAVALVAGFLVYLNWAFTPRGASRGGEPSSTKKLLASGTLDGAGKWEIFESRTEGSADTLFIVDVAGGHVLFATNAPVPKSVRLARTGVVVVTFGQPVPSSGKTELEIDLAEVERTGFVQVP